MLSPLRGWAPGPDLISSSVRLVAFEGGEALLGPEGCQRLLLILVIGPEPLEVLSLRLWELGELEDRVGDLRVDLARISQQLKRLTHLFRDTHSDFLHQPFQARKRFRHPT